MRKSDAPLGKHFTLISRRIDLLLVLPVEKLDRLVLEAKVQAIGEIGLAEGVSR